MAIQSAAICQRQNQIISSLSNKCQPTSWKSSYSRVIFWSEMFWLKACCVCLISVKYNGDLLNFLWLLIQSVVMTMRVLLFVCLVGSLVAATQANKDVKVRKTWEWRRLRRITFKVCLIFTEWDWNIGALCLFVGEYGAVARFRWPASAVCHVRRRYGRPGPYYREYYMETQRWWVIISVHIFNKLKEYVTLFL